MKRKIRSDIIVQEVEYADGTVRRAALNPLYERADILAFHYGIGGCKSFAEFVNMVNEEDPIVITGLLIAANKRVEIMYGDGGGSSSSKEGYNSDYEIDDDGNVLQTKFKNEKYQLIEFLKFMGADKKELNEAIAKIDSGQIKPPENDYSWITPEELSKPGFDLKGVMAQMSADIKKTANIKVSGTTRAAKLKEDREKYGRRQNTTNS